MSDNLLDVFNMIKLFVSFLFCINLMASPLYVYKQSDGTVRFTNKKPPSTTKAQVFNGFENKVTFSKYRGIKPLGGKISGRVHLFSHKKYEASISSASQRYGIHHGLVKAVIHAESGFNPRAVSPKGARGLMQLMPENLKKYGVRDAFAPEQNIEGGTKLLSKLIKKYKGNLKLALAAYNAGEYAVQKYRGIPPYRETRDYVRKVLNLYNRYQTLA